jgi:NAD(P)-dependent dehydrogenase (short-subunit alcohol dehydrogenase family)
MAHRMGRTARRLGSVACIASVVAAATLARRRRHANQRSFTGKVVFITGGSRGLGLALAEQFLREGAHVAIAARDPAELAKAKLHLSMLKREAGSIVLDVICNVTDPSSVGVAVGTVEHNLGRIDVLVNNAGIMAVAPWVNQSKSHFEEAVNTNFYGAMHTTFAILPGMLEQRKGSIVNIASIGGLVAVPHMLPYTASKFALVGFSRGLHAEVKSGGVNVLTVCPWLMRTGSHIHAKVGGKKDAEYRWFGLGATLPLVAVTAQVAARQIVKATAKGKSELLISGWALIASKIAANAPTWTASFLSLVNQALPSARPLSGDAQAEGQDIQGAARVLPNALGKSAELRWNQ